MSENVINILLMGETGVGKSTFINSFANYIKHNTFEEATKSKATMLIPTYITVYDEDEMDERTLVVGSDKNEKQEVGSSGTQSVKTYKFPIEGDNLTIQLIDTPGLGDTKGVDKDDENCETILGFLSQVEYIHGICLLMKPSNDRDTALFSYCARRVLGQLHKSAADNVVFLFTNTKGSDYRPGSTLPILKRMRNEIASQAPFVEIPLTKNNIFCLDNESFKHLLALEYGVTLNPRTVESCKTSWEISCTEINRFMDYVKALRPHNVKKTVSVHQARDLIMQLSKPLADICQLLQDNIIKNRLKEVEAERTDITIEELKKTLYKPGLDLQIINIDRPATVCTFEGCTEPVQVGSITKFRYKTRCHDPCLLGFVVYEVIGHWSLMTCSEMNWSFLCKHCDCSYKKHMTIYYDTKIVEVQRLDEDVLKNIESEELQRKKIKAMMEEVTREKEELEAELEVIKECAGRFAFYLQNNAITSSHDAFKEYIHLSLERERNLGNKANYDTIAALTQLLEKHNNFIAQLQTKQSGGDAEKITEETIQRDAEKLYKLKYTGAKIKEIFAARETCAKNAAKASFKTIVTETIPNWFFKRGKKN